MKIRLGYSAEMWKMGVKTPINWETDEVPHLLISGVTGGGKSVLAQIVVNQLLTERKDISICDYKAGGDWNNIVSTYAEYKNCDEILKSFYGSFVETIDQRTKKERFLVFDEFSSYAISKEAKDFKDLMSMISHIAFMGRSFGYHLIFISQQFNAKVIDTAIREQFAIKIYMGSSISTESATMLFPNSEIDKSKHLGKCCGYISTPHKELDIITIPYINEPYKLKKLLEKKGKVY